MPVSTRSPAQYGLLSPDGDTAKGVAVGREGTAPEQQPGHQLGRGWGVT